MKDGMGHSDQLIFNWIGKDINEKENCSLPTNLTPKSKLVPIRCSSLTVTGK